MAIVPDTKDWTWVLQRRCDDCSFDAAGVDVTKAGEAALAMVPRWRAVLMRPDARDRPNESTWSVLEYGCHVRDVFQLFAQRLRMIRVQDDPRFGNWDQDDTAVAAGYHRQDPGTVAREMARTAREYAAEIAAVSDWSRSGRRGPSTVFTADTLTRYAWHDLAHHLHDVRA